MTIRFDYECDTYLDSEDPYFQVGMNEEDDMPEFNNQTDFWYWYYDVERALKV